MRNARSQQLIEVERELLAVAVEAESISLDIGDHADELHYDRAPAQPADKWMSDVLRMRINLKRAEGLLRAYQLMQAVDQGENDDNTEAGTARQG